MHPPPHRPQEDGARAAGPVVNRWANDLHDVLISIAGHMSRPDVDAAFLDKAGVKLESALFPLLCKIDALSPIGVVGLACEMGRDHSTISRQVTKLETLGVVERLPDPNDQRVRLVQPSKAGRQMLDRFSTVRQELMDRHFADWTPEELDELVRLLRKMRGSLRGEGN